LSRIILTVTLVALVAVLGVGLATQRCLEYWLERPVELLACCLIDLFVLEGAVLAVMIIRLLAGAGVRLKQ
jgi:hypothetical protein